MKIFRNPKQLQKWAQSNRAQGRRIALVPTMGYLHEGHMSLIKKAKQKKADEIIVSIFVNPTQFGPNEDFEKYPRDEKADLAKCRASGATAVFFPTPQNMYLEEHSVFVNEKNLSQGLCGARRPGHFEGVCTVVAKLFNIALPHFAIFGQKDYQQYKIIERMVRDLNFNLEVVLAPIVREKSGLAKSSRNTYLSECEAKAATVLSRGLFSLRKKGTLSSFRKQIESSGLKVDYIEAVDSNTLKSVKKLQKGVCVLVAAFCGKTRLIDNIII